MATVVVYNGTNYSIPSYQDTGYAQGPGNLSTYLVALATGCVNVTGTQSVGGNKTFTGTITFTGSVISPGPTFSTAIHITPVTNQIILGTTNTTTLSAAAPASSAVYTIPDVGTTAAFVMTAGNQTIAGIKTFSSGVLITPTTNQLVLGVTNTTTISAAAPAASRTYTIPDTLANSSFVMTDLAQTLNGVKTFSSGVDITAVTNQLILGTTNTVTLTSPAPASSATYTIPDVGTTGSFAMTEGTQTINGAKTFGSKITGTITGHSDADLSLGGGTVTGTVSQTGQPSFLVLDAVGASNVTGDNTVYTMVWGTEIYDQANNFASNTFTAPTTGRYQLCAQVAMASIGTAHTYQQLRIATSNRNYYFVHQYTSASPAFTTKAFNDSVIADMDANDTVTVTIVVNGSTKTVGTQASDVGHSQFSGSLIN